MPSEKLILIAQLRNPCTTVAEARKSLGQTVQFAEGKRRGSSLDRQGEWFFLETSQNVRVEIDEGIKKGKVILLRKVAIGDHLGRRGGNPHTVEEMAKLPSVSLAHGFPVRGRSRVFVRGAVRHRDHKTVKFNHWREVIANNEGSTSSASSSGVFWID